MTLLRRIAWLAGLAVIAGMALWILGTIAWEHRRVRHAQWNLRTLEGLGYFNWRMDHGDRCPPSAVAVVLHSQAGQPVDPWGTLYQLRCYADRRLVAFSAGPDRIPGTGDDIYRDRGD